MSDGNRKDQNKKRAEMPSVEKVQEELTKAENMGDFFGRDGIFARLFANTLEQMPEAELSAELGYEPYEFKMPNITDTPDDSARVCSFVWRALIT